MNEEPLHELNCDQKRGNGCKQNSLSSDDDNAEPTASRYVTMDHPFLQDQVEYLEFDTKYEIQDTQLIIGEVCS